MLALLAASTIALVSPIYVCHGQIQYGDKDKEPTKKEFVVALYSDHAMFEAPGLWKIAYSDKLVSIYDLDKSRLIEYVPSAAASDDKPSLLYPYVKQIFPLIPLNYAMAQEVKEGEDALNKIKVDSKASYHEEHLKPEGFELPDGQGIIEVKYLDRESGYKNEISWWLQEDKQSLPLSLEFSLTEPDGMQYVYSYSGFMEEGDDPDTPALDMKETIRIAAEDLDKKTENGKKAIKWLEEIFQPPKFGIANHGG